MSRIDNAFRSMRRVDFLPQDQQNHARWDTALPIGHGQTNSQPTTVRMMLKWLNLKPGHKVLDVGSGSGWTTALLSYLVGSKGKVYAVERVPELLEFGRRNCQKLKLKNVEFHKAKNTFGLPEHAPYVRILVSASASRVPSELVEQLALGGIMVIPVDDRLLRIQKDMSGRIMTEEDPYYRFLFVPLII